MLNFNTIGEIAIKLKLRSNVRHFPGAILFYSSRSQAALNLKKWVECAKVRTSGPRKLIAQNPYFHNGNKTFPWLSEDHSKTYAFSAEVKNKRKSSTLLKSISLLCQALR